MKMERSDTELADAVEDLAKTVAFGRDGHGHAAIDPLIVPNELGDEFAPAFNFFRACGEQDGEALFVFMARRKALTLAETAWPILPDETQAFFDVFARVAFALVKPATAKERAELREVVAAPRRVRDTIFDKGGRLDEKIGRGELSAGQPTSTSQVTIVQPSAASPGDPFAAYGGKDPGQWTEEEKLAFATKLGMPAASEKTDRVTTVAPPAGKFKPQVVKTAIGGEKVEGKVFVFDPNEEDGA